jgi:hypothetical protein
MQENMKNKIFKTMVSLIAVVALASCNDVTTEGFDRITYYPVLTLLGDATIYIPLNSTYTEPGYEAEMNGEDVSEQVVVKSTVNTASVGLYSVTYSIANSDGISASQTRGVYVYDASGVNTDDLSGNYTSTITRTVLSSGATASRGPFTLTLTKIVDGHYFCSDLLAGWYWIGGGSSYAKYHYDGIIRVAADGTVTSDCIGTTPWGGYVYFLPGATYDFGTGVMTFVSTGDSGSGLNAYQWACTLTKE